MATKTKCQLRHAKRRAAERYDLELTDHDIRNIVKDIQNGSGQLIRHQSRRVSIWSVFCSSKECIVVYDKLRKNIASFLPIEAKYVDAYGEMYDEF